MGSGWLPSQLDPQCQNFSDNSSISFLFHASLFVPYICQVPMIIHCLFLIFWSFSCWPSRTLLSDSEAIKQANVFFSGSVDGAKHGCCLWHYCKEPEDSRTSEDHELEIGLNRPITSHPVTSNHIQSYLLCLGNLILKLQRILQCKHFSHSRLRSWKFGRDEAVGDIV